MILVAAVLIGLIAGLCRAWIGKRQYRAFDLKLPILVVVAFLPQYFAFFAPKTRGLISNNIVAVLLVSSLILLLVFSILNIKKPGFWPIFAGFFLNFVVIVLNGGFMPISVETVQKMTSTASTSWMLGQRFGYSKDIILSPELTRLAFLSDRFVVKNLFGFSIAFSLGDILISLGIIWLLWMLGGPAHTIKKEPVYE